jgi:hypothetical protein
MFPAVVTLMSALHKPYDVHDCWSKRPVMQASYQTSDGVSCERFLMILAVLHMNDNDTRVPSGKLGYDCIIENSPHSTQGSFKFSRSMHA